MKRKFILLPITLTALAPAISLVGCGDPDTPEPPEPEYIKVELEQQDDDIFCSQKINLIKNKKYRLVGSVLDYGVDNFYFNDSSAREAYGVFVDVIVDSFTFKGGSVNYETNVEEGVYWYLHCKGNLKNGSFEIKLSVNTTINNVYAFFTD